MPSPIYTITLDPAEMGLLVSVLRNAADDASHDAEQCIGRFGLDAEGLESNGREWRLRTLRDRLLESVTANQTTS